MRTTNRPWRVAASIALAFLVASCGGGGGGGNSPGDPGPLKYLLHLDLFGSGAVVSSPAAVACAQPCSTAIEAGTGLALDAAAGAGYSFEGWSGACSGTSACTVAMNQETAVAASFAPVVPVAAPPRVNFTDALSGPVVGGEGNQGAYLSIFGTGFGTAAGLGTATRVYIGDVEVANYRYLGPAKAGTRLALQQLTVQVGSLGAPRPGQALPVKVVVNGTASNVDHTFTPNPGRILFVALEGNDATALAGDIRKPWRHLQTPSRGGAYSNLRAGDHVVIRGGEWSDTGFETAWLRFRDAAQMGSPPTGQAGTGWIHITAYPGQPGGNAIEDVHYSTPARMKGGIHGPGSAYRGTTGEYVSVSNLRMDVHPDASSDAAPINLQYSAGNWRVVNNLLGPWPSTINSKAAGVAGNGANVKVLGNRIYGMACTGALENHGIYADSGASDWEIAYNHIHDITGGNLIQFFDNLGAAGDPRWPGFTGMLVHHNWLDGAAKYGLNLADGIVSGAIWNNVVINVRYAGLRINTASKDMDVTVAFNTFYNNDRERSGSGNAQVLNTWGENRPTGRIRIYNNLFAAGPDTLRGSSFYENTGNADNFIDFRRNAYWDGGHGWATPEKDLGAVAGNPRFASPSTGDFSLRQGSVAIDRGTQALTGLAVMDDITGRVARPQGVGADAGAFERAR
jgi:hypothetical protein